MEHRQFNAAVMIANIMVWLSDIIAKVNPHQYTVVTFMYNVYHMCLVLF